MKVNKINVKSFAVSDEVKGKTLVLIGCEDYCQLVQDIVTDEMKLNSVVIYSKSDLGFKKTTFFSPHRLSCKYNEQSINTNKDDVLLKIN